MAIKINNLLSLDKIRILDESHPIIAYSVIGFDSPESLGGQPPFP